MVLTLGCANKLVCCCSSVNYSWHLLLLSCRAAKIWQFCNPCLQAIHKPHWKTLHSPSTLKVQQCGCCQKPATCFLLLSVGFRTVEEETLLMSLVMVSRGSNWEQVHTTEWVRCVNTAGRESSAWVWWCWHVPSRSFYTSLPSCAWEVSPVDYTGVLLGSWSSVHPLLLPGGFSLSSCFALWKTDCGADDKCGTVMTQQRLSWSRAAPTNPLYVPVKLSYRASTCLLCRFVGFQFQTP